MHRELFEQVRDTYRTLCDGAHPLRHMQIIPVLTEAVGLTDRQGKHYRDPATKNLVLAEKRENGRRPYSATEISPAKLAEAIIGPDWKYHLGIDDSGERVAPNYLRLREEAAAPIGPSIWGNVAAWTGAIGGLYQAAFTEGYQQTPADVVDLFPTRTAVNWQGGERIIDILGPADPAPAVGITEEMPDMAMSAMWIEPGPMQQYGGKVLVSRATAAIDISGGQFLQKAKTGGGSLKLREQELALDIITGQTNNWRMGFRDDAGATGYATYGPTITRPDGSTNTIPNDLTNPFSDIGAVQKSNDAVAQLYHPLTDNPIDVDMNVALFPSSMQGWPEMFLFASSLSPMSQTTAVATINTAGGGTFPNLKADSTNPWRGVVTPRYSRWLDKRHRDATTSGNPNRSPGLGLTGANVYRWYRMDPSRFACRRVMWEPMSVDLNPSDYIMAVQNIIAGQVFHIAVQYQVLNPYAIQRNKVS